LLAVFLPPLSLSLTSSSIIFIFIHSAGVISQIYSLHYPCQYPSGISVPLHSVSKWTVSEEAATINVKKEVS
jgi:hypothetical protein